MTAPTPDLAALVEEVLAEHTYKPTGLRGVSSCGCGEQMHGMPHDHRDHVAAVLVSRLGPVLDARAAEALLEAADAMPSHIMARGDERPISSVHMARRWLRARADAAARPETTEGER